MASSSFLSSISRLLLANPTWEDYQNDLALFFGVQALFFVITPVTIMLWRLQKGWKEGFMTMLRAPNGRTGSKRSPASALRFFLFQQSSVGYYMDVAQVRKKGGASI